MPEAANEPAMPPKKRVRLNPERRREQIIEAATLLVSRYGFHGVSLGLIADEVGVRKSSVLHYFPSMTAILEGVLQRRDEADRDAIMVSNYGLPPEDARRHLTRVAERNLGQREIVRLYKVLGAEALAPDHPAHDYFVHRDRRTRALLRQMLTFKRDPDAAAAEFVAFWEGLELEWLRDPELDFLAVWHRFCDGFFTAED